MFMTIENVGSTTYNNNGVNLEPGQIKWIAGDQLEDFTIHDNRLLSLSTKRNEDHPFVNGGSGLVGRARLTGLKITIWFGRDFSLEGWPIRLNNDY